MCCKSRGQAPCSLLLRNIEVFQWRAHLDVDSNCPAAFSAGNSKILDRLCRAARSSGDWGRTPANHLIHHKVLCLQSGGRDTATDRPT
ncbi:hypothetical protein WJX73_000234 [Symbiochloris irregularis]|uniref:Uncharacterized protein n=1 Tax=Symbiochloris irregularis TaxID=706552 RepID=A0AAW1P0V8_9CHLO